jgi:hypothetical protein
MTEEAHMRMRDDLFNVVQFFDNGTYEYVRRNVGPREAVDAAHHYCTSIGAKMGVVVRVIITDSGDFTNFEWINGKGYTTDGETYR